MIVCNCVLPQTTGRMCARCEGALRQQQRIMRPSVLPPEVFPFGVYWWEYMARLQEGRDESGDGMRPEDV